MPETMTADLVTNAARSGRGVIAFNVLTLEHAEAVVRGAEQASSPVILQVSQDAVHYHYGALLPLASALRALADAANVPVSLHLDHVKDRQLQRHGAAIGFSSLMIDGGRLTYAQNVKVTAEAVRRLHEADLFVEAQLGYVRDKDTEPINAYAPGARTDPQQACEFVSATKADALAVAVSSRLPLTTRTTMLDFALINRLRDHVSVPLMLYGTCGVSDADLRRAVRAGIVKISIGAAAVNPTFTDAVRRAMTSDNSIDPQFYLGAGRTALVEECVITSRSSVRHETLSA